MSFGHHLTQCSQGPSIASEMEAVEKKDGIYQVILRHFLKFGNIQRPPKSTDPVPKWDHWGKEGGGGDKMHSTFLHKQNLSISKMTSSLALYHRIWAARQEFSPALNHTAQPQRLQQDKMEVNWKYTWTHFLVTTFRFHPQTSDFRKGSTQTLSFLRYPHISVTVKVINDEQEWLQNKPNFIICIPGNEPTQCRPGQSSLLWKPGKSSTLPSKAAQLLPRLISRKDGLTEWTSLNPGIFLV